MSLWGSAYTSAGGELLISGGSAGPTVTNQGFAYRPWSNSWTTLPNSGATLYRSGSACGFYQIGGSTGGVVPEQSSFAERLAGYPGCAAQVPWLAEQATSFTVRPGQTVQVSVTVTAASTAVTQPGTYAAALQVGQDTPYPPTTVGVRMRVSPPPEWGQIAGTVTGRGCQGQVTPLAGASVQIDTWSGDYTLTTGLSGRYALWMDVKHNPLELIASENGWQAQTRTVRIKPLKTTTANFTLKTDASC
jgi:hypothetical protein